MSSPSKVLSAEVGNLRHPIASHLDANLPNCSKIHFKHRDGEKDEDEEEEEDVDFNPFLIGSPSLEGSSSLSSEIEGLDADVADSKGNTGIVLAANLTSMPAGQVIDRALGDSEHGVEILTQTVISSPGAGEKESEYLSASRFKKRKVMLSSQPENETSHKMDDGLSSGMDVVNDAVVGDVTHSRNAISDIDDDDDAICKRTRARYSLAGFTLDELETFLQETDDDDDLQNVDDEEEYRKFLAAVLGGDGDSQIRQGNENMDDEDEDNDADFEIEIEEALESDLDENTRGQFQEEHVAAGRRPETRQKRRQKASGRHKKRPSGLENRPLRPLIPNAPISSFPVLIPETSTLSLSSSGCDGFINGFTPRQLGQLHCLIHEHVQLLIQVFSLCVLEPSRKHIASQVQELMRDILHKRDQIIARRRVPYPCFFFCPPYIHPSVEPGLPKSLTAPDASKSACYLNEQRDGPSGTASNGHEGSLQTSDIGSWVPLVNGPVLSVMDVAPLNLVGKYIDDVSTAVQENQKQYVQAACDTPFKKEPLFPFRCSQFLAEVNPEVLHGANLPSAMASPSFAADQQPKKTLAATLVERTKKQSIALVPKAIVDLARRFLPLFNPALFPHKAPPATVANRVLFTDAEDELLAMGLMEYSTDWKAIQQRFLPCKSKHQIFVRQKNRSSSKASENPIKTVRRMKSSPLTGEEIARIEEGLKVFKLDWMSVWKYMVPYRDPSLLPRQWRIATGTQKSYKSTADKKEKRRLYAKQRRKCSPAALASWQTSSEKEECQTDIAGGENNSGDDCMDNEEETYVHEAFLADWRPSASFPVSYSDLLSQGPRVMEQTNKTIPGESLAPIALEFPAAFKDAQNVENSSEFTESTHYASAVDPNHHISDMTLRPSRSQFCSRPYRSRRTKRACLVKLAPGLPPVNLPPSVRVMSQSAFKNYQSGESTKLFAASADNGGAAIGNLVSSLSHIGKSSSSHPTKSTEYKRNPLEKSLTTHQREKSLIPEDNCLAGDKGESDLQMHPLLFQSFGDGNLPYYPLNCSSGTSGSFNFFSRIQPQLNLSLLHNPHQENQTVTHFGKPSKSKGTRSSAGGIDFHPLLQKVDDANCDSVTAQTVAHVSANPEPLRGGCPQLQNSSHAILSNTRGTSSPLATCTNSCIPNEKPAELDLDIHLSFASQKEKAMGCRYVTEHNPTANSSGVGFGITTETRATKSSCYQNSKYCLTGNKIGSGAHASVLSNNISMHAVDNEGDQSLPEIVMEQEELSDSEDEIGEGVEFECEEMDDSEGDNGSDSEQNMEVQNKEIPNATVVRGTYIDDKQLSQGNLTGIVSCTSEGGNFKPSLLAQGKETPSSPLCLSLSSCAPSFPSHNKMKTKAVESMVMETSSGKNNCPPSRRNRGCKKPQSDRKNVAAQKHAVDVPQQQDKRLESGSSAVTPLRGPRKSVRRSNSGVNVGRGQKSVSNVNTGVTVENSNHISNSDFG